MSDTGCDSKVINIPTRKSALRTTYATGKLVNARSGKLTMNPIAPPAYAQRAAKAFTHATVAVFPRDTSGRQTNRRRASSQDFTRGPRLNW